MENQKSVVVIDVETTGTDVCNDRIVQIAARKLIHGLQLINYEPIKVHLINPGVPIPSQATEIHKITDDMVKDAPSFAQIAKSLHAYLDNCDLAGFNILSFDVPMISEEFARCGIVWPADDTNYFDSYRIFADKERRDLSAASQFYLNTPHENAHEAAADVNKTVEVLKAQLVKYNDLSEMSPGQLSKYCVGERSVDLAGKIVLNDEGIPVYSFGKHKGTPVIAEPGFANWMLKESFPTNTKNVIRILLGK